MDAIFNACLAVGLASLVLSVIDLFTKRRGWGMAALVLLAALALGLTIHMGLRWAAADRPPFSNMFESLILFAWTVVVIFLLLRIWVRINVLTTAASLLAVVTLAYGSTFTSEITPLMPALQSNWLTFHVFSCFLGYGGFAISFATAICYLVATRAASRVTKEIRDGLELATAKTISFGFLFLSIGIITGAVWANSAWGTYWSWDPKETWSLITWIVYAAYLHCRFMRGWRGKPAAWIAIVGFLSVLFTYVGVNLLLKGLHSYALNASYLLPVS